MKRRISLLAVLVVFTLVSALTVATLAEEVPTNPRVVESSGAPSTLESQHDQQQQRLEQILERPEYQRWRLWQSRAEVQDKSQLGQGISEELGRMVRWLSDTISNWLKSIMPQHSPTISPPSWFDRLWSVVDLLRFAGWQIGRAHV